MSRMPFSSVSAARRSPERVSLLTSLAGGTFSCPPDSLLRSFSGAYSSGRNDRPALSFFCCSVWSTSGDQPCCSVPLCMLWPSPIFGCEDLRCLVTAAPCVARHRRRHRTALCLRSGAPSSPCARPLETMPMPGRLLRRLRRRLPYLQAEAQRDHPHLPPGGAVIRGPGAVAAGNDGTGTRPGSSRPAPYRGVTPVVRGVLRRATQRRASHGRGRRRGRADGGRRQRVSSSSGRRQCPYRRRGPRPARRERPRAGTAGGCARPAEAGPGPAPGCRGRSG